MINSGIWRLHRMYLFSYYWGQKTDLKKSFRFFLGLVRSTSSSCHSPSACQDTPPVPSPRVKSPPWHMNPWFEANRGPLGVHKVPSSKQNMFPFIPVSNQKMNSECKNYLLNTPPKKKIQILFAKKKCVQMFQVCLFLVKHPGMIRWKTLPKKFNLFPDFPLPCSPVQSARKFSAVFGTTCAKSSKTILPLQLFGAAT